MKNKIEIEITQHNFYKRLDKVLRKSLSQVPLSKIYYIIRKGHVSINGKIVRQHNYNLHIGDIIEIDTNEIESFLLQDTKDDGLKPVKMDINVIYEDEYILAINKPSGISVHPGKDTKDYSILNFLLYLGEKKKFTPHLVHRLDKYTSGVLLVAKNKDMARRLSDMFSGKKIKKKYNALVWGEAKENFRISIPLDNTNAITNYTLIKRLKYRGFDLSYLEVEILTGKKHQIRRHLSMVGLPIVGDDKYGDWNKNKIFKKDFKKFKGYFLHCRDISFIHPVYKEEFLIEASMEIEKRDILAKLYKLSSNK